MRLFIAEKPSLARAIADVLPGPHQRQGGYLQCGPENVVAWCAGHILELAPPDAYDARFKEWRVEDLPITPQRWRLVPTAPDLLRTIKSLLPRATRVVHAGDPDREGQLLIDEVLEFLGYRGPVDRLLISDMNPPAVRSALAAMQSNVRFRGLYEAALARQRADWLYGINLTRLHTVLGRAGGHDGVLSVGRVQTPLLGLIVRRDAEIETFQPSTYFTLTADLRCGAGAFKATWQPAKTTAPPVLDGEDRLVSRDHALAMRAKVERQAGTIVSCRRERKRESPPLPYSLPDLQMDAGRRLGMSPKQTLDACQALYETHRLLTYPRSDCGFLPEGQLDQTTVVLAALATNVPELASIVSTADRSLKSRAWNDKKVTAHHAIIPTARVASDADLSSAERQVYGLVARRYIAQFLPAFEYDETRIEIEVARERFRASGRQTLADGWRRVVAPLRDAEARCDCDVEDAESGQSLPMLDDGERVTCADVAISEKQTRPPKRFTDATLIEAMTGISRYVADPKIKQLLRETDGIGTPATQADIIATLFERRFIEKRGRQIVSTPIGRALVSILPDVATRPDMTALWEAAMRRIADGQLPLKAFLETVTAQLRQLVERGRSLGSLTVPGARACTAPGCTGFLRRRQGPRGSFWSCTRYPECKQTAVVETTDRVGRKRGRHRGATRAVRRHPEPLS
jgi:DNA topoisomerase III